MAVNSKGGGGQVAHDFTATTTAITAGDVVVIDSQIRIAKSDIAANRLGALYSGGLWDCPLDSSDTVTDGEQLYWDSANSQVTVVSTGNIYFGPASGDEFGTNRVIAHNLPNDP